MGEDVLGMVGNKALPLRPKCGYAFLRGVCSLGLMGRIAQLYMLPPPPRASTFSMRIGSRARDPLMPQ